MKYPNFLSAIQYCSQYLLTTYIYFSRQTPYHFMKQIGFQYALKGIRSAMKSEFNFRLHLFSAAVTIILGFVLKVSTAEWCVLILAIGFVLVTELMNTAIEQLVNLVQPDFHPIAGKVKDIAAGAVFVAAICALICGLFIFGSKLAAGI